MAISFDTALGIHEDAIRIRARRSAILSNNLANADTPGFEARDIDFQAVLKELQAKRGSANDKHKSQFGSEELLSPDQIKYRVPLNPSQDGNTVEPALEYVEYAENALRYQASLNFLSSKFKGIISALKGGQV